MTNSEGRNGVSPSYSRLNAFAKEVLHFLCFYTVDLVCSNLGRLTTFTKTNVAWINFPVTVESSSLICELRGRIN